MDLAMSRGPRTHDAPAPRGLWLVLAVVITLALSLTPYGRFVLYPFKLFTTWVHEVGHATMALMVGGSVDSIIIRKDTSGLTRSVIPDWSLLRGLVASSGYLGASIVGCLLIAATRLHRWAHRIIWALGAVMLLTGVVWMRNAIGLAVVLGWGAALLFLGRHGKGPVAQFVLSLLAVQVALNAIFDIRVLFQLDEYAHSDAMTMQNIFLLPAGVWAGLWMVMSVGLFLATLWVTREREV